VAIGFEVNADIEAAGRVVQMLDARRGAYHRQPEVAGDVGRASSVGVGRLHDANAEVILEAGSPDKVGNEGRRQRRDAVAVKHGEPSLRVNPIVDQTVRISIQRAAASAWNRLGCGRSSLLGLDKVGTAL